MRRVYNKLFLLLSIAILMAGLSNPAAAQRSFGVIWDPPENRDEAVRQLKRFEELQIGFLEIDRIVSDELWEAMADRNFDILVQIPVRYPTVETFSDPDSGLVATYRRFIAGYAQREIDALGMFEYGQTDSRSFPDMAGQILGPIREATAQPLYIKDWNLQAQPVDTLFDFKIVRIHAGRELPALPDSLFAAHRGYLYHPAPELSSSEQLLRQFIEKTSANGGAILFFHSGWLLDFLKTHPRVEPILRQYATQPDALFPTSEEQIPHSSRHSGIVLILLLLWGSFALNYSFEPMYRKSLFRYFFSHKFFVEDVVGRHIRSVTPSLLILVQHAIMGGIFLYCFAAVFLSQTGAEVFFHHFQNLRLFGTGLSAFFLIGAAATLVFELICLFWLYLANYRHKYLSQTVILYSWSLQVNLLVATIMVTLLLADTGTFLTILLILLFLANLIAAFPITAFDTSRYLSGYKIWYWTGTLGLYIAGIGGLLLWLFNNNFIMNVIRLSVSIH